jgi:chemosensory pili system protein ChpB (putative protein-glutamate methylesterase)
MSVPKVGILSDDRLQQHHIKNTLVQFGFDVLLVSEPSKIKETSDALCAWIVDYPCDDDNLSWLDDLLDGTVPVLMGIEKAPQKTHPTFPKWERKLHNKLHEFTQGIVRQRSRPRIDQPEHLEQQSTPTGARIPLPLALRDREFSQQVASHVWMLGASLGGPEAVKIFLDALPKGLPIGFIYAQHIDPRFEKVLCKSIGRHSEYRFKNFQENQPIYCGEVLVAPIEHEFVFDYQRLPHSLGTAWPGPYGPSISQMITNTDQGYATQAGYILFSGMGNDGAQAISALKNSVPIWAQSPESCANASMPESAIATGKVSFIGDPYQLALQLVNWIKHQWIPNHEPITH